MSADELTTSRDYDARLGVQIPQWIADRAAQWNVPVSDRVRALMSSPDRMARFAALQTFVQESFVTINETLRTATDKITAQAGQIKSLALDNTNLSSNNATLTNQLATAQANAADPALITQLQAALAASA